MNHWVNLHIGQRMRQRRWMIGMPRQILAQRVGCAPAEIERYEMGVSAVGAGHLWGIAAELEVPVWFFFEGVDGQPVGDCEALAHVLPEGEGHQLVSSYYALPTIQRQQLPHLADLVETIN